MTGSELHIRHDDREAYAILEVRGELDLTSAEVLENALASTDRTTVVLDLRHVTFVDSAGMRTIDVAHRRVRDDARRLLIVAPPDSRVASTFRVAGFDAGLVLDSLEAAISSLEKSLPT